MGRDHSTDLVTVTEKAGELHLDDKAGKTEICSAEGEWEEHEVSIWDK